MKSDNILETKWQEIRQKIKSFQSGATAEGMYANPQEEWINFGLDIRQIISIARTSEADESLAQYLQTKKIREAQILALFLIPSASVSPASIAKWSQSLMHQEQAEVWVQYILQDLADAWTLCLPLLEQENYFARMTGNILTAKLATRIAIPNGFALPLSHRIITSAFNETHFNRSIAFALAQLYLHYPESRESVVQFINETGQSSQRNLPWIAEEIKTIAQLY